SLNEPPPMSHDPFEQLKASGRLPSPPGVAMRLLDLVQREESSLEDFSLLISSDPALVARILRYVNSPLVGLGFHGSTLDEAVARIGLRGTQMIALSFSLVATGRNECCASFNFDEFWSRSLACALTTRALARWSHNWDADEAFITGLLARIGRLAFATALSKEYESVLNGAVHSDSQLDELERLLIGADQWELGARVLAAWHLPEPIWNTIDALSRRPDGRERLDPAGRPAILALGDAMAGLIACGPERTSDGLHLMEEKAGVLGMPVETLHEMLLDAGAEWAGFGAILNLETGGAPDLAEIERLAQEYLEALRAAPGTEPVAPLVENPQVMPSFDRDETTGALNRHAFDRALSAAIERVEAESKALALILIDIDHFERINYQYGEAAGDAVLRHCAGVLREAARKRDEIFRCGGDEFAVIAGDVPRLSAMCLAEALCSAVTEFPATHEGVEVSPTISAGIAWAGWPDNPSRAGEMMRVARARLEEAKRKGRNCCVIDPEPPAVPRKSTWVTRIGRVFSHAGR
ncbi:MAG: sensor domain-containing diguanylate cyclase, partial [Opitutaceae bacterium]